MADADMQASARRASANQDAATQDAAIAFLADPASHGVAPTDLRRIDTHGAIIVLAGDRAYKMKRAVRYSFMDFSTLDLRERACRQEIALNRRTAPDIYLGLMRILRRADGRLALVEANEGDGDTIDWVVAMRRFDPDATLDRIADRHGITDALADQMAAEVIALHDGAEPLDAAAGRDEAACMIEISRDNVTTLSDRPDIADPDRVARYAEKVSATLDGNRALFAERVRQGAVRRCHGDLHLRNIALIEGWPVIFDAIEFDDALATTDWLYDLAFLLMDLWTRGEGHAANRVMNGVLAHHRDALDLDGLALLPAFLSIRAAVRSKVALLSSGVLDGDARTRKEDEARWFFDAAERFIAPETPRLVAIGGLSGSGKTTAARALCPDIEPAPGALHLRSDVRTQSASPAWRKRIACPTMPIRPTRQGASMPAFSILPGTRSGPATASSSTRSTPGRMSAKAVRDLGPRHWRALHRAVADRAGRHARRPGRRPNGRPSPARCLRRLGRGGEDPGQPRSRRHGLDSRRRSGARRPTPSRKRAAYSPPPRTKTSPKSRRQADDTSTAALD